jgi:hypothetical protein
MFLPWVIAASESSLRVETDGTPAVIVHPAGRQLIWLVFENVGFFALLISFVVWLAIQGGVHPGTDLSQRELAARERGGRGGRAGHCSTAVHGRDRHL